MAMRIRMLLIVAALGGGLAVVGAQGCFYASSGPDQYGQQYGSGRTVCDANGRNCMVCDADNRNCQRVQSQSGSSRTVCDANGQNCMVCDADNRNCRRVDSGSSQGRSWGFWF
ncbi:MAG TPA: hypothetical protein VNE63_01875 [Candidatus Acidoferrales bacterium]|nr:hypothetical protein [Candidatus Acidoferrales bacterium]